MLSDTHPHKIINHCPRCGSSQFNSREEGISFSCEDCGFVYFVNSSAAVACLIFNSKGELMLSRRAIEPNRGMLDLPGGFVDVMETAEEAVRREINEELGIAVTGLQYLTSFPNEYVFSGYSVFTLDMAFVCQVDDLDSAHPKDDISAIEFYDLKTVPFQELCSDSMRNIIEFYLENKIK
ncbi:NUDIX domain-containing protein [Prolixibacter sp. NT017]|uniref:NUDIX hydrolase n=1 Tax=Prolixibacter sp. NT017 TaxID=2652390 RepID=UPI001299428F|nr:NUDIX domain-containing protein [Prolixibacter sp. NT017]